MKKIYFLIASAAISLFTFAQTDPNAKKALDDVAAGLRAGSGTSADFTMTNKTASGKLNNTMTGKLLLKGSKYYIKYGKSEIFSDGSKTWNYNGGDEVTVTKPGEMDEWSPEKILVGEYGNNFTYRFVTSSTASAQVQLTPVDKRKSFQRITVYIDKAKRLITRLKILDKSNNTIDLSLKNINTKADLDDDLFTFDKSKYKKNIEVIE